MIDSVALTFSYDPDVLKAAGVDLDSGTLQDLKTWMLEKLAEDQENLRENLRYDFPEHENYKRRLALIEAFLIE